MSRRYFLWNGHQWLSLALLMVTLGIAVRGIEQAKWLDPQPSFLAVLGLGLAASILVARLRIAPLALLPGLLAGVAVTVWQVSGLVPPAASSPNWLTPYRELWLALAQVKPSQNHLYFAIFLTFSTWSAGFLGGWFLLRKRNPWFGAIAGAAGLLVNLSFATEAYYGFFLYYVISAMVLICQAAVSSRLGSLKRASFKPWENRVPHLAALMVCLSLAIVAAAWMSPQVKAEALRSAIYEAMPWGKKGNESSTNFFNALTPMQTTMWNAERNELTIGGPVDSREVVLFEIKTSSQYSYWRSRRYEVYRSSGWSNRPAGEQALSGTLSTEVPLKNQTPLSYTVTNKVRTDVILTGGAFLSADILVILQRIAAAGGVETGNVSAVTASRLLNYNDSYTVKAVLTSASPAELSQAGDKYPQYVRDIYLPLPAELPSRVKQLAASTVNKAQTPYDRAIAVIDYLKRFTYVHQGTAPPPGRDAVDDFLFNQKSGNCTNFASAAVVLLRASGVPARLAAGYLSSSSTPGSVVLVKARDYHAWPEVYFPGYGWVEFEATPFANVAPGNSAVPPTPGSPSATPAPTPEPGSSPTPNPSIPAPPQSAAASAATPSPSPANAAPEEGPAAGVASSTASWLRLAIVSGSSTLALAVLVLLIRRARRWKRWGEAQRIYARMCSFASLIRRGPAPNLTPLEYGEKLVRLFPAQAEAINNITGAYVRSYYGKEDRLDDPAKTNLRRHWRSLLRAFLLNGRKRAVQS